MKSLIRWSATVGLIGGVVLGALLTSSTRVLALTEQQIAERLRTVPVFALTDNQGSPLVATPSQGDNRNPVAGVFISRQDAMNFLNNLKQKDPQTAQNVQVVPVSLAEVYNMAQRSKNEKQPLTFAFIPQQQEVQQATTILQQSGQNVQRFEGVPIFVARTGGGQGQQNGSYLTIKQGDKEVIPMFFTREDLQRMLDRLKQVQPNLAATVNVQVVNLEGLIQTLQSSNNQDLNQILLVPPQDSLEFVRSLQQQGQQGQRNGQQPQQPSRSQATQGQRAPQAQPAQPTQPHQ